jgi:hypothetical protein
MGRCVTPLGAQQARVEEGLRALPMSFEPNLGQTDSRVQFLSRGAGHTLFLASGEAVLALAGGDRPEKVLRIGLAGSNPSPRAEGREALPGRSHYFRGADPTRWRSGVPHFARVHFREVYPGIDLAYYGNGRQLEYDFILSPGADPEAIALRFEGADRLAIDGQGDLVLGVAGSEVRQVRPFVYQEIDGNRRPVAGRYVLKGPDLVGFQVAAYDRDRALVLDPVLAYSTYLGGTGYDEIRGIAVDASGNAYVTGTTRSVDFPVAGGGSASGPQGDGDAFVVKIDPAAGSLVYATYLGGGAADEGTGIASDGFGSVTFVTGSTESTNFPTSPFAFDISLGAPRDAFLASLDASGALTYATYFGGDGTDWANGITVRLDAQAGVFNIDLTGGAGSPDFPITQGAVDPFLVGASDAFVSRFVGGEFGGVFLVYSTFLGGSGEDEGQAIGEGASGHVYVAGATDSGDFPRENALQRRRKGTSDAFVVRLNLDPSAPGLVYSTYLGGECDESASGIAVDPQGNAYVSGTTNSRRFPSTRGSFRTALGLVDGFVTKIDPTGRDLLYSTYLGGSGDDRVTGIAAGSGGAVYVTGITASPDFPSTPGFDLSRGGSVDAFVTRLNPAGNGVEYSVFLGVNDASFAPGRNLMSIAANPDTGAAYVAGFTASATLVTSPGSFQIQNGGADDGFVMKIN